MMEKKYRLLVIDDSEETVAGLEHFFSKKYEVFTAADGMEGLKFFETEEKGFDLVITDLVMPFISGVGVISIIKKKYPGTPVIAITGWGEHPGALATEAARRAHDVHLRQEAEGAERVVVAEVAGEVRLEVLVAPAVLAFVLRVLTKPDAAPHIGLVADRNALGQLPGRTW